ncbi:Proline dehydrogenase [subsurface metagenome]
MFGLLRDFEFCHKTIREIVKKASENHYLVRIDMEDSQCTDLELRLFQRLYHEFPENVGVVLQSYLKRTFSDLENLKKISDPEFPVNIRLCKGIYIEPESIAYKEREEINTNFLKCLDLMFANNIFPAIATHDNKLIWESIALVSKYGKSTRDYEFQMLYGVTPRLRDKLVDKGHTMRVYVPYGQQWFQYSTRRLKENPHLVRDIILGFLVKK